MSVSLIVITDKYFRDCDVSFGMASSNKNKKWLFFKFLFDHWMA